MSGGPYNSSWRLQGIVRSVFVLFEASTIAENVRVRVLPGEPHISALILLGIKRSKMGNSFALRFESNLAPLLTFEQRS